MDIRKIAPLATSTAADGAAAVDQLDGTGIRQSAGTGSKRNRIMLQRAMDFRTRKLLGSEYLFCEKNTSSMEFLEKLIAAFKSGHPLPRDENRLRIAIAHPRSYFGEGECAFQMMNALNSCGCDCIVLAPNCAYKMHNAIRAANPDVFLSLTVGIPPQNGSGIVSVMRIPASFDDGKCKTPALYENFIYCTANLDQVFNVFQSENLDCSKIRSMRTNLSVCATEFCDSDKKTLLYCGVNWDWRRKVHHAPLYDLLDKTGYFAIYGPKKTWGKKKLKSYRGEAARDGNELLEKLKEAGVALVLHSDDHINSGAHSSRIFEAAAASCVIISDRHPFAMKTFGNSIFYVDQNASPAEMFRQIDGHMRWILANQEEAKEMAQRSHEIFMENFTMESEMEKLKQFLEELIEERKKSAQTAVA
ncbi:MAG: hypothetical protein LBB38_02580 [Puniceicoccales bacterium]|nr:hypothetical protein [Puniceicoccales bacterium]